MPELLKSVARHVVDRRVLHLIKQWLECPVEETDGRGRLSIVTVLDTTMDGQALDPEAPDDSTITELGLEREGLRGDWLAISAKMGIEDGEEDDGMAGVYLTELP
jgi:hypothetical protein